MKTINKNIFRIICNVERNLDMNWSDVTQKYSFLLRNQNDMDMNGGIQVLDLQKIPLWAHLYLLLYYLQLKEQQRKKTTKAHFH